MAQLQTDSLDQQFQELESESGVDSELAELKKKMGM
jgi:phage shock protein A